MHWTGKVEPIAFTIFNKDVAWYGIILTCAMLIGLFVGLKLAKRNNIKSDDALELFLIAIPLAIIAARLGFVFAHFKHFFLVDNFKWQNFVDIIAVWDGGLTIMTGAPAGILGGFIWCKWRKVDFFKLADSVVFVMLLSQGLGRWGNFMNQELYGLAVENTKLQWFPYAVYIANEGGWFQAAFFYEMVLDILGFFILWYVSRHLYMRGSGVVLYGMTYCVIRFIMEFCRDSTDILGIPNTNRIFCAVAASVCLCIFIAMIIYHKKRKERIWYAHGIPPEFFARPEVKKDKDEKIEPTTL